MSVIKTTEEFSSTRRFRYGGAPDPESKTVSTTSSSRPVAHTATFSPHKSFFGRDENNNEGYYIEFNIGDFNFDEITIKTEGKRLIVKGQSKGVNGREEVSKQFTRDFTLPYDVDPFSIKAQLDEHTRVLTLIGQISEELKRLNATASTSNVGKRNIGSIKENHTANLLNYQIFLGNEFKEGKASIELNGYNTLTVRVTKLENDKFGDANMEFKRTIKLPPNANPQNIEHMIDSYTASLVLKVPLK